MQKLQLEVHYYFMESPLKVWAQVLKFVYEILFYFQFCNFVQNLLKQLLDESVVHKDQRPLNLT